MSRRHGSRRAMFVRVLLRAALVRRGRALAAVSAVIVGAAVATAMLDLYADVGAKLSTEFRNYGANLVVVAKDGGLLPADALTRTDAVLEGRGLAVPFGYAVARTTSGQPVVVAGTDLQRVRRLNTWWSVSAWPAPTLVPAPARGREGGAPTPTSQSVPLAALVGVRALPVVAPDRKSFSLTFQGRTVGLTPAGTVHTGAAEDSRVFLDLNAFIGWTGVQPSAIEVSVTGAPPEVEAAQKRIADTLPQAEVRPVRQIVEAEARVLDKTRATLLAATIIIIVTAALCLFATLLASVLDRRRDFAIMKALGASERLVSALFTAEAAAMGVAGAMIGFGIGVGVAAWIGRANFHAAVAPRFSILPAVLAGSMGVALLAAALPVAQLRRVQPATILRGE